MLERVVSKPFFIDPEVIFDPHHPGYDSQIAGIADAIADVVTKRRRSRAKAARLSQESRQKTAKR